MKLEGKLGLLEMISPAILGYFIKRHSKKLEDKLGLLEIVDLKR